MNNSFHGAALDSLGDQSGIFTDRVGVRVGAGLAAAGVCRLWGIGMLMAKEPSAVVG